MNEVYPEVCQGVVVAEPAWIKPIRKDKYGTVSGLDEEELADPDELERQIYKEQFWPVLSVPVRGYNGRIRPSIDEDNGLDWGAFATVDFDRYRAEFDKLRYKADKLNEELRDVLIRFDIIKQRIPGRAKAKVLKYLKIGVIELGHIVDMDMYWLAELYLRARRFQREIARLKEVSRLRQVKKAEAFWASLG